ncbi:MAG: nitrile hydratase accessory protein [Granulosicoccus sp.]|jgi:nitrile hydratase accessory protein
MSESTIDPATVATSALLHSLPSIPRDNEGPVFNEPWQAEIFAMTLSLHAKGVFSWPEWADQLTQSIQSAQDNGDPDLGDTYYLHWLDALEKIVVTKGISAAGQLGALYSEWENAASTTPHGQTIELPQRSI